MVSSALAQQQTGPAKAASPSAGKSGNFAAPRTPSTAARISESERKLDCPTLRRVIVENTDRLKRLTAQARRDIGKPPPTLARLYARATGGPGAGLEPQELYQPLHARTVALVALYGGKGCGRLDLAELLRPAPAPKPPPAPDRCRVRTDFDLEDCVEDIAQWRCRAYVGKGRAYPECLEAVGARVIAASGFMASRLDHFEPGCKADDYASETCSVFANDRTGDAVGVGTTWCRRVDEATIETCDVVDAATAAAAKAKAAPPAVDSRTRPVDPVRAASPKSATAPSSKEPAKINCHPVHCRLGTCQRLCTPPT